MFACGSDGGNKPRSDAGYGDAGAAGEAEAGGEGGIGASTGEGGAGPDSPGTTVSIDQKGGKLELEGVTLDFPAGAVAHATPLTLKRVATKVPGYELYSDEYELSPPGTEFAKEVRISLPFTGDETLANLFASRAAGPGFTWRGTDNARGVATAQISRVGRFFVANGGRFTETPADSCSRVDVVDGVFSSNRALSILARATDSGAYFLRNAAGSALMIFGGSIAGVAESAAVEGAEATAAFEEGSFSITDWTKYPEGMARPTGPVRVIVGEEYAAARAAANETNAGIRAANGLEGSGLHIHEIQPVKFGGSPTDLANKMLLPAAEHIGPEGVHTQFWTPLMRWATAG